MSKLNRLTYPTAVHSGRKSVLAVSHGLMGNAYNWNTLCSNFASRNELKDSLKCVQALDMRNHGSSPHSEKHTCALMASDIEQYIYREIVEPNLGGSSKDKSVFIGHSMGGVAMMHSLIRQSNYTHYLEKSKDAAMGSKFAEQEVAKTMSCGAYHGDFEWKPEFGRECYEHSCVAGTGNGRIGAVVIVDVAPIPRLPTTFEQIRKDLGALLEIPLEKISSTREAGMLLQELGVTDSQMRNFLLTNLKFEKSDLTGANRAIFKSNVNVLRRDLNLIAIPDSTEIVVNKCELPVLFVFGKNSPYYSEAARENIPKFFSNADTAVIDGAGHFVHHEKPKEFVDVVTPFISKYL